MRRYWTLASVLLGLPASAEAAPPAAPTGSHWEPTLTEEFDGSSLDTSKWNSTGWVDNPDKELQGYRAGNVEVSSGTLKLRTKQEDFAAGGTNYHWSSGKITTQDKFYQKYGYFEARIKLPSGKGLWPAWWALPQPMVWPPEFDILEVWNYAATGPTRIASGVHYGTNYPNDGGNWAGKDEVSENVSIDLTADFHTYGLEWTDSYQTFYFDDTEIGTVTSHVITTKPQWVILQVAIDGGIGTDATTANRAMEVDYVHVFKTVAGAALPDAGGTGGSSGSGGAASTGGSSGAGGSAGKGGAPSTGGSTGKGGAMPRTDAGAAGASATGGAMTSSGGATPDEETDVSAAGTDGGCACRMHTGRTGQSAWPLTLVGVALAVRRRRARREA